MARPQKKGLEYFPMDVNTEDGKLDLFEAEFGIEGLGFFIKLLQKIYANSYFLKWDDDVCLLFSSKINVSIKQINVYINSLFRRQLLDKCLHEKYGVLTSRGIQNRYIEATQRRKEVDFILEYLLIDVQEVYKRYNKDEEKQKVIVNIYSINADNNSINDDIGTQSKVNKIKEDISKYESNNNKTHARVGYEEIMNDFNVSIILKDALWEFIQYRQLNKNILLNSQLESIICRLDASYVDEVTKVSCVKAAIKGGYLDIKTDKERLEGA